MQSTMAGSLPSLPTEIWKQIFENFCVHCHPPAHSNVLPDFRLPHAREGQATLKNLCLVSRECHSISQDILFHYFYNLSNGGVRDDTTKDLTPCMLRTLISNPCLGKHVRMMALFDGDESWNEAITRQDLQSWIKVSRSHNIKVPDEIALALEPEGSDTTSNLFFIESGPMTQVRCMEASWETRFLLYEWMYFLLISLAPRLSHLQLEQPIGPFEGSSEDGQILAPTFPNVRALTYNCFMGNLTEFAQSLANFPLVSTFGCYDFLLSRRRQLEPISSIPKMVNIRKLSISGTSDSLSNLLNLCPHLEDLEIDIYPGSRLGSLPPVLEWPTHTKANLKRLAWSNQDSSFELLENCPDPLVVPLMEFKGLEILEIDQSSLLLHSRSRTGEISSYVLPETLRILHVAFAMEVSSFAEMSQVLRELATAKTTLLSNLSIVKVDHPPRSIVGDRTLAEAMSEDGVVSCMNEAGIDLRFGLEELFETWDKRCLLPVPPGALHYPRWTNARIIYQREFFPLEDLKSL